MPNRRHKAGALCYVLLSGCGYIGDPQYPAVNIPNRVGNLSVIERGHNLDINFTIPDLTTEGLVVKSIGSIDLRVGPSVPDFHIEPWAQTATRIETAVPAKLGLVHAAIAVDKFAGQKVIVAVRLSNAKGRLSEWSNLKELVVVPGLDTPGDVTTVAVPAGVQIKWQAAGAKSFKIYRSTETEPQPTVLASTDGQDYIDTTTVYGKRYEYYVQGLDGDVESEVAGPFAITPVDKFAPAVPAGLAATPGLDAIELAWERNTEPDFRGYRVYRSPGGATWERIADLIESPNYSDRKVESGKRYRYAVTSVDQTGNESEKSPPVEAALP